MLSLLFAAALADDDPILDALAAEVDRELVHLAAADVPAYHLAAELLDELSVSIIAEYGALQPYDVQRSRRVDVEVRVGSPDLDNTHFLRNTRDRQGTNGWSLGWGDAAGPLARGVWRETAKRYDQAVERYAKVEAEAATLVEEDPAPDLVPVEPVVALSELHERSFPLDELEALVREGSATLRDSTVAHTSNVFVKGEETYRWLVTGEGTRIRDTNSHYRVGVSVTTTADDGAALGLGTTWDAHSPERLPDLETVQAAARELETTLALLRDAPDEGPYEGPVLLSGRATAVFFHEIFGHRIEGHRLKQVDTAQTFKTLVGEPILPSWISVHDDPLQQAAAGEDLNGHYHHDNEGVPAQRVTLVEDGALQGFLNSRSPYTEGETSNGHGRRQPGYDPVTRQGNLLVSAAETTTTDDLREQLRQLAEDEGLPYALYLEEIRGGFTFTQRSMPNAFKIDVLLAWRVYVDGRPDELVRGVDLIGTPLVTFGRIVAAGDTPEVFNGYCGAESGYVPVSAVSPPMLIERVETQRKAKQQRPPPLITPPWGEG